MTQIRRCSLEEEVKNLIGCQGNCRVRDNTKQSPCGCVFIEPMHPDRAEEIIEHLKSSGFCAAIAEQSSERTLIAMWKKDNFYRELIKDLNTLQSILFPVLQGISSDTGNIEHEKISASGGE